MIVPALKLYYIFNDHAHLKRFVRAVVVVAFFATLGLMVWPNAYADSSDFSCAGSTASGDLFTTGGDGPDSTSTIGTATAYQAATNTTGAGNTGSAVAVMSGVLQFFKTTVSQIMSNMYCGVQNALIGPLSAAMTIFVVVFGILIITGMTKFDKTQAGVALFKMALIWGFATHAEWGIGLAYRFFMGVAEEGSSIVLSAICGTNTVPTLNQPDSIFSNVFNLITGGTASATAPAVSTCINMTGGATAPDISTLSTTCKNWLMVLLGSLTVFSPGITSFAAIMIIQYLTLYVRALLGYLAALVLISFLFVLSPIFISFALFKFTFPLFQKWLEYLISFSLQMVVIFGLLALLAVVAGQIFNSFMMIMSLLREYDTTFAWWHVHMPMTMCGICDTYNFSATSTGLSGISCTGGASHSDAIASTDGGKVITVLNMYQHQDLVVFIMSQTLAWWLIAYVLQEFIEKAPQFARALAGVQSVAMLGGGQELPGVQGINYLGLNAAEGGLKNMASGLANSKLAKTAGAGLAAYGLSGLFSGANASTGTDDNATPTTPRTAIRGTDSASQPRTGLAAIIPYGQTGKAAPADADSGGVDDGGDDDSSGGSAQKKARASNGAAESEEAATLRANANGMVQGLQSRIASSGLPPERMQQVMASVNEIKAKLVMAQDSDTIDSIMDDIAKIQGDL